MLFSTVEISVNLVSIIQLDIQDPNLGISGLVSHIMYNVNMIM